jgi:hypothetical protein
MDDLAREMLDTVEQYKAKADDIVPQPDGTLRYFFNTRTPSGILMLRLPHRPCIQPPRNLEDRYGLTGLAAHYQLPEGLTATDVQAYVKTLRHAYLRGDIANGDMQQRMQKAIDGLTALNPALKELRPDPRDPDARFHVLQGIASDFTAKDMQFYIDGNSGGEARRIPAWAALKGKIDAQISIGWIPCLETMQAIDAQLKAIGPARLAAISFKNHRPKV